MTMLTIGRVAEHTGITVETLRFYEKQGLIDTPQRSASGYRQYPAETLKRLRFIQRAKQVGFTLKDIAELLDLRREPGTSCTDIKIRATQKIEEVDRRIRDLTQIRDALGRMVIKCRDSGSLNDCPILEELEMEEE